MIKDGNECASKKAFIYSTEEDLGAGPLRGFTHKCEVLHKLGVGGSGPCQHACDTFFWKGDLPTSERAHDLLLRLRSDHDYFMKELATIIKAMREITVGQNSQDLEIAEIRTRMKAIRERLEVHNVLEEEQAYTWPMVLFDEATLTRLAQRLKQELENVPPRFT